MNEQTGWLLDLYADSHEGIVIWFITSSGERLRLHQYFPVTFSLTGPTERLRTAWRWLKNQPEIAKIGPQPGTRSFST